MKILILNPQIDASHQVAVTLQSQGHALLLSASAPEAWQLLQLHGSSVEIAVIHREGANGQGDPGLHLLKQIKTDSTQSDLPVILTSLAWGDAEFVQHQETPEGANAYLRSPYSPSDLIGLLEAIVGPASGQAAAPEASHSYNSQENVNEGGLVLEDAAAVLQNPASSSDDGGISLEAPDFGGALELSGHSEPEPSIQTALHDPTSLIPTPQGETRMMELDVPEAAPEGASTGMSLDQFSAQSDEGARSAYDLAPDAESEIPQAGAVFDLGSPGVDLSSALAPEPDADAAAAYASAPETSAADEQIIAQEMPYLLGGTASGLGHSGAMQIPQSAVLGFAQPVGDAVVPGGAAQSPDLETLKKYLLLREQDVAALSTQLKSARDQVSNVEEALRLEKGRNVELMHVIDEQKRKIEDFEKDKALTVEGLQNEINELKFQIKAKADKGRILEHQVREATEEMERLKERVRQDIRKIRVREKELENRLEIMKKDSEALMGARENKIIELKRKLDLLEFNMDLLQDQYSREKEVASNLRERLSKAAQVVRVAGGLLNQQANGGIPAGDDSETELPENADTDQAAS